MRQAFWSFLLVLSSAVALCQCEHHHPQPAAAGPVSTGATSPAEASDAAPLPEASPITEEECRAQSGEVIFDRAGAAKLECPTGLSRLGSVLSGVDRGLCCAPNVSQASGVAAPPSGRASSKRTPCALGTDQTCNEDPSVSAIWGRCTELGVCECKPGFVLTPLGRCRPN